MTAQRIHRTRSKGWRMPEGAVYVGRPTKWGNPFKIDSDWITWTAVGLGLTGDELGRRRAAVLLHRAWITGEPITARSPIDGDWPEGGYLEFSDGSLVSLSDHAARIALIASSLYAAPVVPERPDVSELRGRALVCWCPLDHPCHSDVLLEVANA